MRKSFKLSSPVPKDLVGVLTKDPARQQEILKRSYEIQKAVEDSSHSPPVAVSPPARQPKVRPFGAQSPIDKDNSKNTEDARNNSMQRLAEAARLYLDQRLTLREAHDTPRPQTPTSKKQQSASGPPVTSWAAVAAGRPKTDNIASVATTDSALPQGGRYNPLITRWSERIAPQSAFSSNPKPPLPASSTPFSNHPSSYINTARSRGPKSPTIYVRNLPWSTTDKDLAILFSTIGRIVMAKIQYHPDGRSRGSGIVEFDSVADAVSAIESLSGFSYGGRDLDISFVKY